LKTWRRSSGPSQCETGERKRTGPVGLLCTPLRRGSEQVEALPKSKPIVWLTPCGEVKRAAAREPARRAVLQSEVRRKGASGGPGHEVPDPRHVHWWRGKALTALFPLPFFPPFFSFFLLKYLVPFFSYGREDWVLGMGGDFYGLRIYSFFGCNCSPNLYVNSLQPPLKNEVYTLPE
jgi:hypothetical protein